MFRTRTVLGILILVLALAGFAAPASAAEAKSAFGTVDIEKAFTGSEKGKQLIQELRVYGDQLKAKLETRKINRLLTSDEFNQLADLQTKPNQTADDKQRVQDLLNLAKQREIELQGLQQKQNPSDTERARLGELQEQISRTQSGLQADVERYQADFDKRNQDIQRQVLDDISAASCTVAKEKGLQMVFTKMLGTIQFVLYSSADITDDVIKAMNKK